MAPIQDEEVNPYELLGISIESTESEIKSAYRKLSLKVHPDRHPDNPDAPRLFHELNQAYELLLDPVRRLALDAKVRLKEDRKKRFEGYDNKRKQLQQELEERERAFKKRKVNEAEEKKKREQENERVMEEGRRMMEEREKKANEQYERQHKKDSPPETATPTSTTTSPEEMTIKLKFPLSSYPSLSNPSALATHLKAHHFKHFDDQTIVLSVNKKHKVTALVPFLTIGDAFAAVCAAGEERRGLKGVDVSWASGKEPSVVATLKGQSAPSPEKENDGKKKSFGSFAPSSTTSIPGMDFESITLMRLRQAERERLEQELREQEATEA